MPLFEYRRYEAIPGKLPALHHRFETITTGLFKKHGIEVVGFWVAEIGTTNELHYIVRYDDMAHREQTWGEFQSDQEWITARAETERNGPLVARVHNEFWRATEYSPLK
jgi:hypothetical protein